MMQKKLEKGSKLDPYDFDGDGVVTDSEIDKAKEIGPEEVNKYGTIIKFFCYQTDEVIIPEPKPKLQI